MNNLTGVTTILAGLQMGPVERLKKTWSAMVERHPKSYELLQELAPIISSKFQYSNYRKYVKEMQPPAIPFLGVNLTDLTFIEDGNQDFLPDTHLVNFDKRNKVYQLIHNNLERFQQVPYALHAIPSIQEYLKKITEVKGAIMTYKELEDVSLVREALVMTDDEDDED